MNESEFYVNGKETEKKQYTYYFEDGTTVDSEEDSAELKKKACAYTMHSSYTRNTKWFVRQSKGFLFDPNEVNTRNKENFAFKNTNAIVFKLYTEYLNPKKRSRFRIVAAQKNL